MNDPSNNYYKPPSQKKKLPGLFDIRTKIHSAVNELRKPCHGGGGGTSSICSNGSIHHPFSVQNNDSSVIKHYEGSSDDWILFITWCCCTKEETDSRTHQWPYKSDKILEIIQQKEVNKSHTSMYKFYEQHEPTFATPPNS
jgi:hypothetical protein